MALLLLMWPIGGLVGAIVGQSLNRTREGAILGFVLGFIGVVIVVCMDRKPAAGSPLPPAGWRFLAAEHPVTPEQ
jgi:predicted branched-subunit amino acid permease